MDRIDRRNFFSWLVVAIVGLFWAPKALPVATPRLPLRADRCWPFYHQLDAQCGLFVNPLSPRSELPSIFHISEYPVAA